MGDRLKQVFELDRTIHEPARLMICALLYGAEEADFLYLLHETGLTKGNLSSHLARLEQSGYVAVRKWFDDKIPRTTLSMTPKGRKAFEAYRRRLQDSLELRSEVGA